MKFFLCVLTGALILVATLSAGTVPGRAGQKVYVISVSGPVEPAMAAYIQRAVAEATKDPWSVILFKLDTFGGRVDAAFDIVHTLMTIPRERSIAYVEKKAISAGALIALASGTLVMQENTLIGDCAPMVQTKEGSREAGEKIQTVLRAQFRTLARRNHYPEVLAQAMVSKGMTVYQVTLDHHITYMDQQTFDDLPAEKRAAIQSRKTVVAQGHLLTMDDKEAVALGFSKKSVTGLDQALTALGYDGCETVLITETWSERLIRKLHPFLPLLMLVGIGAIYTEIKAPGFGLPGIIGVVCLGVVFFNQFLVGLADYTEILLFLIGFLLLGMEVFVLPGFGVAGLLGLLVMGVGLVLSLQGFVIPDPSFPWETALLMKNLGQVLGTFVGALGISFLVIRFVLPGVSRWIKGPYLSATLETAHAGPETVLDVLPGQTGMALTPLRPSGKIKIHGRKLDGVTQGEFIDPDTRIQVVGVEKSYVIVRSDHGIKEA
jgi:membrane-bound serine protease (ClpP class)